MVELNLNDIHVPESEIRKAYDAGYAAKVDGKPKEGACPFVLPAMQRAWLAGYEFAATLSDNPHEPQ